MHKDLENKSADKAYKTLIVFITRLELKFSIYYLNLSEPESRIYLLWALSIKHYLCMEKLQKIVRTNFSTDTSG